MYAARHYWGCTGGGRLGEASLPLRFLTIFVLVEEGVGKDVGVDLHGVFDFVATAAAAAFGVGGVVEAVVGIDDYDFTIVKDAAQSGLAAGFQFEVFDGVDGFVDFVIERDVLEAVIAEEAFELALEGGVPFLVGAGGGGEEEAAVFEVLLEVVALGGGEVEVAFTGHDDEGNFEEFLGGEFDGFEASLCGDGGFLLDGGKEFVGETLGCFGSGVDEVAALDSAFFGEEREGEKSEGGGDEEFHRD